MRRKTMFFAVSTVRIIVFFIIVNSQVHRYARHYLQYKRLGGLLFNSAAGRRLERVWLIFEMAPACMALWGVSEEINIECLNAFRTRLERLLRVASMRKRRARREVPLCRKRTPC